MFHRFTFLAGFLIILFLIFYRRKAKKNIQNLSGGGSNDSVFQVPSKNYTDMVEFLHTSLQLTNIIRKIKDDMFEMWCFVFEKARIEISHECDEYHMVSWYLMVSCRRTHQNQRFSYTSRVFFGFRDTHTLIFYRGIIYKRRNE